MLDPARPWVLDGSFLRDPAFAGLVAALRPYAEAYEETIADLDGTQAKVAGNPPLRALSA